MTLIVIEGPDGSGKTTLAKQLAVDAGFCYHRTPGQTSLGRMLRAIIKDTDRVAKATNYLTDQSHIEVSPNAAQLMMMVDLFDYNDQILSKMSDRCVVLDRIPLISGIIYGDAMGADVDLIRQLGPSLFSRQIDYLFILSSNDIDLLQSRVGMRDTVDLFETDEIHRKTMHSYNSDFYNDEYFKKVLNGTKIARLDAALPTSQNIEKILNDIKVR